MQLDLEFDANSFFLNFQVFVETSLFWNFHAYVYSNDVMTKRKEMIVIEQ